LEYKNLEKLFQDYINSDTQSLSEYHKAYFQLGEADAVSFNKEQRIVIVGYDISPEIRQTSLFLRRKDIRVTSVEFNYFLDASKEQLMSIDIVIGKEPLTKGKLTTEKRKKTDKKAFLNDLDESTHQLFEAILALAEREHLPIRWGAVGFSLNTDVDGNKIALIMGYPRFSVFSQTIYTYVPSVAKKVKGGEKLAELFKRRLLETGLFQEAGNEMKYIIKQKPTEEQTQILLKSITDFATQTKKNGLIE
jgi:hypothetical protein